MNYWKTVTLLSAAAATLAGCGVRIPTAKAESRSAQSELAAPMVAVTRPSSTPELPPCIDENAGRREAASIQLRDAQQNYEQSKIAAEQAELHANEVSDELRSAQWHRDQEQEALEQAQQREIDVRLQLDRDTQLARIGAVAASALAETEDAARAASSLVSAIQSAVDSSVNEVSMLEDYQRQSAQELRQAQDHVSETQNTLAAIDAAFDRLPPPGACAGPSNPTGQPWAGSASPNTIHVSTTSD